MGSIDLSKHPWMTKGELVTFKQQVKQGNVTFFRQSTCQRPGCEESIPKGTNKEFCSEDCFREVEDHGRKSQEEESGEMG